MFIYLIGLYSLEDSRHVRPAKVDVHVLAREVRHGQHKQCLRNHVHGIRTLTQAGEIHIHIDHMSAQGVLGLDQLVHVVEIEEKLPAVADHPHHPELLQVRIRRSGSLQRHVFDRFHRAAVNYYEVKM